VSASGDGPSGVGKRTAKLAAEKSRSRGRRALRWTWQIYALWAALGVSVAIVLWFAITLNVFLAPAGASVTVPSLEGLSLSAAQTVATRAHLELRTIARRDDYRAPKDDILGQLPAAGEHVREGRSIDVIVSDGVPTVKVPNVSSMSQRDATVALENAHLTAGAVTTREQSDVTAGIVLDQKPDAFTDVPAGSKVDLVVARGRPLKYAPNFVGYPASFAATAAKEAGIALDKITMLAIAQNAKPKGMIVAEDPPAGSPLLPNQRISLQVSGGAPPTPVPLPSFPSDNTAIDSPAPNAQPSPSPSPTGALPVPESARAMRVSVALPASSSPARVRVVLLDARGSRTLYDQDTTGGFTLSFDVTVTGAATIETFVNDALVNSTAL
jgi:beta-lactam-binding protein with PASTA domain